MLIYAQAWAFSITPGRSGEAIRALWLQQRCGIPVYAGLTALAAERITGLLAGLLLLVVFLSGSAHFLVGFLLALMAGLIWIVSHPTLVSQIEFVLPTIGPEGFAGIVVRGLRQILQIISHSRRLFTVHGLGLGVGTALVTWMLESGLFWFLWHSIGSSVGLRPAVVVRVAMGLAGVLSLFPGGLGVGDGTALGISLLYGITPEQAIGATFLFRLLTLGYPMTFGLLMLAVPRVIAQIRPAR